MNELLDDVGTMITTNGKVRNGAEAVAGGMVEAVGTRIDFRHRVPVGSERAVEVDHHPRIAVAAVEDCPVVAPSDGDLRRRGVATSPGEEFDTVIGERRRMAEEPVSGEPP